MNLHDDMKKSMLLFETHRSVAMRSDEAGFDFGDDKSRRIGSGERMSGGGDFTVPSMSKAQNAPSAPSRPKIDAESPDYKAGYDRGYDDAIRIR
jgi:hypothetical protein